MYLSTVSKDLADCTTGEYRAAVLRELHKLFTRRVGGEPSWLDGAALDEDQLLTVLQEEKGNARMHVRLHGSAGRLLVSAIKPLLNSTERDVLTSHTPESIVRMLLERAADVLAAAPEKRRNEGEESAEACFTIRTPRMRGLHQLPCTPETALRRVQLVRENWGRNEPPAVLLLGDDDLVSLRFSREVKWSVVIMDVDRDVLESIDSLSKTLPARIITVHQDFRLPLPANYRQRFDVVMADPSYSQRGLEMFLRTAAAAMKRESASLLFLSADTLIVGADRVKRIAQAYGFVQQELRPRFNEYVVTEERRRRMRRAAWLFGSTRFIRTLADVPLTFSDMFVFQLPPVNQVPYAP